MNTKNGLRKTFLLKRRSLQSSSIETYSKNITQKVLKIIKERGFKSFHIYTECRDGEVDTKYILEALSHLPVSISTYSFHSRILDTKLIQGKKLTYFDCIIVPGIVFDLLGYRIGYGGGVYDRFLSVHSEAFTIGIGYDWQVVPQLPIEEHDIPVNLLLTNDLDRIV